VPVDAGEDRVAAFERAGGDISPQAAPDGVDFRTEPHTFCVARQHVDLPGDTDVRDCRAHNTADVGGCDHVAVDYRDFADAEMNELRERHRAGAARAADSDMEPPQNLLAVIAQGQTLPVEPLIRIPGPLAGHHAERQSDDLHVDADADTGLRPCAGHGDAGVAGHHHGAVRAIRLREERRHQDAIPDVVSGGELRLP
jgi:hypothetical protein